MASDGEKTQLQHVVDGLLNGDLQHHRMLTSRITLYLDRHSVGREIGRDDFVSEIISILVDNMRAKKFRGDSIKSLNVYIQAIVDNRLRTLIKKGIRRRRFLDKYEVPGLNSRRLDDAIADRDLVDRIYNSLDPKCRELLELKFRQDLSDSEIAQRLKKSKNAISTAISRCLKNVRNHKIVKNILKESQDTGDL